MKRSVIIHLPDGRTVLHLYGSAERRKPTRTTDKRPKVPVMRGRWRVRGEALKFQ